MELDIYWTQFAEDELYRIFKHYLIKAGYRISKKLVDGIYNEPFKLIHQAEIGQAEEYLKDRKVEFRYILYKKNYKIIYWINREENRIEINDVFDVRQYPLKIKRTL
jgi:plasmid stabilization system protein ParE